MFGKKTKSNEPRLMFTCRTLWVKSINNAVEECQVAEKSILADKAMFTVTGTANYFCLIRRLILIQ